MDAMKMMQRDRVMSVGRYSKRFLWKEGRFKQVIDFNLFYF